MQKSPYWLNADAKFAFLYLLCRDDQLFPADKVVAFALLKHLNHETGTTTVRHATIIGDTGLCDKTVRTSIPRLERQGWFEVQRDFMRVHTYRPVWFRMSEALPGIAAA